jgi:hypothetical protein
MVRIHPELSQVHSGMRDCEGRQDVSRCNSSCREVVDPLFPYSRAGTRSPLCARSDLSTSTSRPQPGHSRLSTGANRLPSLLGHRSSSAARAFRKGGRRSRVVMCFKTARTLGLTLSLPLARPRQRDQEGLRTMTSNERHRAAEGAARRRGGLHRADGDRRVGQAVRARHDLTTRGVGRAWLNGREVGGTDPRYTHLEASHD